jgi:hypothetical protein
MSMLSSAFAAISRSLAPLGLAGVLVVGTGCGVPECMNECCAAAELNDADCPGGAETARRFQEPRFGQGGACWADTESATVCTDECRAAVDACAALDAG